MAMYGLWHAIAGGANQYLQQQQAQDEEDRWMKKQELLEKLREQAEIRAEERQQKNRIVTTTPDYDTGEIIETLGSGESRRFKMPEAAQQAGLRERVMGERERLLKEQEFERQRKRQESDDARAERYLKLQEGYASGARGGNGGSQEKAPALSLTQIASLRKDIDRLPDEDPRKAAARAALANDPMEAFRIMNGEVPDMEMAPAIGRGLSALANRFYGGN